MTFQLLRISVEGQQYTKSSISWFVSFNRGHMIFMAESSTVECFLNNANLPLVSLWSSFCQWLVPQPEPVFLLNYIQQFAITFRASFFQDLFIPLQEDMDKCVILLLLCFEPTIMTSTISMGWKGISIAPSPASIYQNKREMAYHYVLSTRYNDQLITSYELEPLM